MILASVTLFRDAVQIIILVPVTNVTAMMLDHEIPAKFENIFLQTKAYM